MTSVPEISQQHLVFGRVGSFWNSNLTEEAEAQAQLMVESTAINSLRKSLLELISRLTDASSVDSECITILIPPSQVINLSPNPLPGWTMTLPEGVEPIALITKQGRLVTGADFSFFDQILTLRQDPATLFSLPAIQVLCAKRSQRSAFTYPLLLEVDTPFVQEVAQYFRNNQSASQFQRAVAVAAGYAVMPCDGTVLQVQPNTIIGAKYVFADRIIDTNYDHTFLTVGQFVPEGTVIGGLVNVWAPSNGAPQWYRTINWSAGLSLDHISAFKGITVPDSNVLATTTTASIAYPSSYHSQMSLLGDPTVLAKFWYHQAAAEDLCGNFLAPSLGLASPGTTTVNPLDIFFQVILGTRALVLQLVDTGTNSDFIARGLRFARREKPVGSALIVYGQTVPANVVTDAFGNPILDSQGDSITSA